MPSSGQDVAGSKKSIGVYALPQRIKHKTELSKFYMAGMGCYLIHLDYLCVVQIHFFCS